MSRPFEHVIAESDIVYIFHKLRSSSMLGDDASLTSVESYHLLRYISDLQDMAGVGPVGYYGTIGCPTGEPGTPGPTGIGPTGEKGHVAHTGV